MKFLGDEYLRYLCYSGGSSWLNQFVYIFASWLFFFGCSLFSFADNDDWGACFVILYGLYAIDKLLPVFFITAKILLDRKHKQQQFEN